MNKGDRIEFENGRDMLRGTIVAPYVDPMRPDMEETWTVFADSVLKRTPTGELTPGIPRIGRDGQPVIGSNGKPKLTDPQPVYADEWIKIVDGNGQAAHAGAAGDSLVLVKNGVPVPFRVRARRMKLI